MREAPATMITYLLLRLQKRYLAHFRLEVVFDLVCEAKARVAVLVVDSLPDAFCQTH